ncbi:MAG: YcxB family protein [Chitinophagales bacterium]|nr:YcxB family protein [Chitinophagales bacterium]
MNNEIKDTVKYNKELFIELTIFQFYKKWWMRWLTMGGIFCFFFIVAYLFGYNPLQFHQFPYFALFYVLGVLAFPFFIKRMARHRIKDSVLFQQEIQMGFTASGISIAYPNFEKSISWSQLNKIVEHRKAWLFYGTAQSFFYFPKELLSKEQSSQLKEWITSSSKLA